MDVGCQCSVVSWLVEVGDWLVVWVVIVGGWLASVACIVAGSAFLFAVVSSWVVVGCLVVVAGSS